MDPDNNCGRRYPDDYCRCRHGVIFPMFSIFLVTATFPAASMAGENAAGSREQGDNAN
jgi:hypothetical protein